MPESRARARFGINSQRPLGSGREGMDTRIRLALCQINQSVGDLAGNADRLQAGVEAARDRGADLVVFPELSITGYPPEDLLLKPSFVRDAGRALDRVAAAVTGIVAVVGAPVGEAPAPARGRTRPARSLQRRRRPGRRRDRGDLPQAPPAQLRGVRRAALLRAGRAGAGDRSGGRPPRHQRVRGHLGAGRPGGAGGARRGRGSARQPLGIPLPPGQGRRDGSASSRPAASITAAFSPSATRSAGRTSWCSTDTASSSGRTARCRRAGRSSRRTSWSSTSTSGRRAHCERETRGGRGRPPAPVKAARARGRSRRRDPRRPPATASP